MKEILLQWIWYKQCYDHHGLKTFDGKNIQVHHPGMWNSNAGPDFLNANIKIENTLWSGHVEVHIHASEWQKHDHHLDQSYNNVILHVVYINDKPANTAAGRCLPVLQLNERIDNNKLYLYRSILGSTKRIPCSDLWNKENIPPMDEYLHELFLQRLKFKSEDLSRIYLSRNKDWEATLFALLLKYCSSPVNAEAFLQLSNAIPLSLIYRYADKLHTLEALFFGQSGLLHNQDDYARKLKDIYRHLQLKHGLIPLKGHIWKFLRMRPYQFPTLKIAQLAGFYYSFTRPFRQIIQAESLEEIRKAFCHKTSEYWTNHYVFGRPSPYHKTNWGKAGKQSILINAVLPMIYFYGQVLNNKALIEKALVWFSEISAESNSVILTWRKLGIRPKNALESQALIQLKSQYCSHFKCMECKVGLELLGL